MRPIQVPQLLTDAIAYPGVEGLPATETSPTGAHIDLGAFRIDGKFNVSIEMLMASELNLEQLLSTFAIRSVANKVAAYLALGAGTTEPMGLFTSGAVTVGKTSSQQTGFATTDLIEAFKALGKGYRKQAHVVVSDVLLMDLLQRSNDNGDYIFKTLEGGGEQFMGKPMHTEPQADQTSMTAGEVHAVMGDFSGYFVRQCPIFFKRVDAPDPLNVNFVFAAWMDSQVADADALVSAKTAP